MFVRVKRVNGNDYVYLVENVREGGRHVQRVIKTLGRRDAVEAEGLLDQLAVSAARHSRPTLVLSAFSSAMVARCASASARSRAISDTNAPTVSHGSPDERTSSGAAPGKDIARVDHAGAPGATAAPQNLPRLPG